MNKSDKKIDQISFFKVDINKKNMVKFKKEYLGLGWTHNFFEEYGAGRRKASFFVNKFKQVSN